MSGILSKFGINAGLNAQTVHLVGVILAVLAVVSSTIGIVSATPVGDELSSAMGIVHKTRQQPSDVEARNDLKNERQVKWAGYQVISPTEIRVFFPAGTETCYGYRAETSETATSVKVRVYEGNIPGSPDKCILIGRPASMKVTLQSPLGARLLQNW